MATENSAPADTMRRLGSRETTGRARRASQQSTKSKTVQKEISPGMFLTRYEDAGDDYAVVYTLNNTSAEHVYFTMDFSGSINFRLLPRKGNAAVGKSSRRRKHKWKADILRRVVIPPESQQEVARLKVEKMSLPSHLKVHYVWETLQDNSTDLPEIGKPRQSREMIADKVYLVTTRTDKQNGHTKFRYVVENQRGESIKITLDFSKSENLLLRPQKTFGVLSFMLRGNKTGGLTREKSHLVRSLELSAKTKTKAVATLKTIIPGQGWSLQHNIAVEIHKLVRRPLQEQETDRSPNENADQTLERLEVDNASRENVRRESTIQIRSSHGFQNGFLSPQADIAGVDKISEDQPTKSNRPSIRGSLVQARSSLSSLLNFIKPVDTKRDPAGSNLLGLVQGDGPCPPPYRMSWLDAETAESAGENESTSLQDILNDNASTEERAKFSTLLELLTSLGLESHHESFVQQAMEDLALLKAIALDSKLDFRNFLKDDICMDKYGHREAILRAVLRN